MTGFICLNKPEGITSFLAVNKTRRIVCEKKAGHTGTLDPMATGVLLIAFGGATRFIELIEDHDKSYTAVIKLGIATDTLDITGNVLSREETHITREEAENAVKHFFGKSMQKPPMYSALKKDGVRLYDLARKGIEVERDEREIEISKIEITDFDEKNQEFTLDVSCSAGTYIRSLAEDIGKKLGVPTALKKLERTKANGFQLDRAVTLDELEKVMSDGKIEEILLPVDEVLSGYDKVIVSEAQSRRFSNGGELDIERVRAEIKPTYYRVYSPENKFLGIGEGDLEAGQLKVKRVYNEK